MAIPAMAITRTTIFYVRPDGDDANDGSADDAAHAFRTIQKAADVVASRILMAPTTIQVADGIYRERTALPRCLGSVKPRLIGNPTAPGNCILAGNYRGTLTSSGSGNHWCIGGFRFTGGVPLFIADDSVLEITEPVEFGNCMDDSGAAGCHMYAYGGGVIRLNSGYTIAGPALEHFRASHGGRIHCAENLTVTLTGMPSFDVFAWAEAGSLIQAQVFRWVGAASGKKYYATLNALVLGTDSMPGSAAGSTDTGGQAK